MAGDSRAEYLSVESSSNLHPPGTEQATTGIPRVAMCCRKVSQLTTVTFRWKRMDTMQ